MSSPTSSACEAPALVFRSVASHAAAAWAEMVDEG